jgi:NADPH:quinone reductase-like Zn-dependent oxidoreductase
MNSMKAIVLEKTEGAFTPGPTCYHPTPLVDLPIPVPGPGQVLVKVIAAAYNHRDIFLRQSESPIPGL